MSLPFLRSLRPRRPRSPPSPGPFSLYLSKRSSHTFPKSQERCLSSALAAVCFYSLTAPSISSSLVSAGKRKFAKYGTTMNHATLDIEREPPMDLQGQFDIVLSTNCIHATKNLSSSLSHINKVLKPHGFVSLVEFTTRILWFDLVFGLLDGWWAFEDGRRYVLATPESWAGSMRASGFSHVSWTGGSTRESETVRIITGFKQPVANCFQTAELLEPRDSHRCDSDPKV